MSVLLICDVEVENPELYAKYTAQTPDLIKRHGGRFLARGQALETLEGPEFENRLVIVEFPSRAAAKAFYHSPEYKSLSEIRRSAANSRFLLIDGLRSGVGIPAAPVLRN